MAAELSGTAAASLEFAVGQVLHNGDTIEPDQDVMLRISSNQVNRFAVATRRGFAAMMITYIRDNFPEHVRGMDDAALAAWVRRAAAVCERHGVDAEPEAAQTILILLVLGLEYAEHDTWVASALKYDGAPIGKLRRLVAACRTHDLKIDGMIVFGEQFPDLRRRP